MVEENAVAGIHPVGFAVVDSDPVGVKLGSGVGAAWAEGGGLLLGGLLDLTEEFTCGGLVEAGFFLQFQKADSLQKAQGSQAIHVGGVFRHFKTDCHVGLCPQVVHLVGLRIPDDAYKVGGVRKVSEMKDEPRILRVGILADVLYPLGVEHRGPAPDAVDLVTLRQEEFGKVRAVLASDACDEGLFHKNFIPFCKTGINSMLLILRMGDDLFNNIHYHTCCWVSVGCIKMIIQKKNSDFLQKSRAFRKRVNFLTEKRNKKALIFGISGQDGSYLARSLLARGYEVHGTSRDPDFSVFPNFAYLGIREKVFLHQVNPFEQEIVLRLISDISPEEIYNLSGQTSVGYSFLNPVPTFESITIATINILEALRYIKTPARFFDACSGECFGGARIPATEQTPFSPKSPYAVAKAASFWEVDNYRKAYGIFACSGILFNHESPLRPSRFVTRKIVSAAARISMGSDEVLVLGDLSIKRDWGWAPEYVEAMWRMLQQEKPSDFVISTGELNSLENFVSTVFGFFELDWRDHVKNSMDLCRPLEVMESCGDPSRAGNLLQWVPVRKMKEVAIEMARAEATRIV